MTDEEEKDKEVEEVEEEKSVDESKSKKEESASKEEDVMSSNAMLLLIGGCLLFLIGLGAGALLFSGDGGTNPATSTTTTTLVGDTSTTTTMGGASGDQVKLTILNDERCGQECNTQQYQAQLKQMISNLQIQTIDYNTEKGKQLYNDLNLQGLPALLFNKELENTESYAQLKQWITEKGDYLQLRVQAPFDPTAEICDNGKDDTGDGKVDCEDSDCKNTVACMPKTATPNVDLYVMSHCPYGTQTEKGFLPVVDALGDEMNFTVKFCDYAMHGEKELNEQMRQYCIQKEQSDKFIDYLSCFLDSGESATCLDEAEIDKQALSECVNATDEKYNITEMFNDKSTWKSGRFPTFPIYEDETKEYGISGSPGLVINNVSVDRFSRSPDALLQLVCGAFDEKPEACNQQLSTQTPSAGFGSGTSSNGGGSCG